MSITKKIVLIVIVILLIIAIFNLYLYAVRILPQDGGSYCISDYSHLIEIGYKTDKKYPKLKNRWDACKLGQQIILEFFPESNLTFFTTEYFRTVYYDAQSDTWFVYVGLSDSSVSGGDYGCILSSEGSLISCWSW